MIIKIIKRPPKIDKGWFSEELDSYLYSKSAASANYPRKRTIRPSEIGQCTRKIVLIILNKVKYEPVEPKQQRTFDMGNAVHKRYLTSYIPAIGCAVMIDGKPFIEHMIEDKTLWLRGAPDAVIINKQDGLMYIFELKSIKQELFNELMTPSEEYLDQIHLYMHMTKISRAIVFYENKNNQDTLEFHINLDVKRLENVLNKVRTIQDYVINFATTGKLPPKCKSKYCEGCKE
jgi:hypothetical protein